MNHKKYNILKVKDQAKLRLLLISHNVMYPKQYLNPAYTQMTINTYAGHLFREKRFNTNVQFYATVNKVTESAAILWNGTAQILRL